MADGSTEILTILVHYLKLCFKTSEAAHRILQVEETGLRLSRLIDFNSMSTHLGLFYT